MITWLTQTSTGLLIIQIAGMAALYVRWGDGAVWSRRDVVVPLSLAISLSLLAFWITKSVRRRASVTAKRVRQPRRETPSAIVLAYVVVALSAILTVSVLASVRRVATTELLRGRARVVGILAINDVYRIEGAAGGAQGGIARLRSLRRELEDRYQGKLLLLHAGDVLFPSFLSRTYSGAQMVDALNLLDGVDDPTQLDERMFVAFGNHEFERESCTSPGGSVLQTRVRESQFLWLHSNITFTPCTDGRPRLVAPNLRTSTIVKVGDVQVGLFSLTLATEGNGFQFASPLETGQRLTRELRQNGAEIVIAVTHLPFADDQRLYAALKDKGLDLVIGGHDHEHMQLPEATPRIFKADADAVTAWVIELKVPSDEPLRVAYTLRQLDDTTPKDPMVNARVAGWLRAHETSFCQADGADLGCLSVKLGTATTQLDGGETEIRARETSLGNWIADKMLTAFTPCHPVAAFINAGSLRLNQNIPAGTTLVRRHIEELLQYDSLIGVYELTADQLRRLAAISVGQPTSGGWLQMSGLSVVYDPATHAVTKLRITSPDDPSRTIELLTASDSRRYRIVTSDFVATGTDGFRPVFAATPVVNCLPPDGDTPRPTLKLNTLLRDALKRADEIGPVVQGRICTTDDERQKTCLATVN